MRWPQLYAVGLRRFLVASGLGLWLGGFTFYSAVVIHVGAEILGDHRPVGFITQEVSNWLNLIGAIVLAILLWNMAAIWPAATRCRQTGLIVTWLSMAIGMVALVVLHHALDAPVPLAAPLVSRYFDRTVGRGPALRLVSCRAGCQCQRP